MKLFFIKLGKAVSTIKRDGIIKGGRRVMSSFFALFHRVKGGDILFITGGVGDSALYRTHHQIEELELQGFSCDFTVQDNPFLGSYVGKFKIFVFHRVLHTPLVEKMIEKIKGQKKEIIFETDDLVFDPQYLAYMDYFKKMNAFEKKLYEKGVGGEILADDYVKICVTTTKFLAEKLKEKGKRVFISKNKLSKKDVTIAEKILNEKVKEENGEKVRVGYFSGTISHNKDFATITKPLVEVMSKYSQAELFLVGPLDLQNELIQKFRDRIFQLPYVPREKHFENIYRVDINIAPLEIENPFCRAKSELKFFEAGIMKVPTIATATEAFQEAITDGMSGFLAITENDWIDKLGKMIADKNLRERMGERAREKVLTDFTNQNAENEDYYDYLRRATK